MYLATEDHTNVLASEDGVAILFATEDAGPPPPGEIAYDSVTGAVTWPAEPSAASYKVYDSDGPFADYALAGSSTGLSYAAGAVASGAWRAVRVSSVSHSGLEGPLSVPVVAVARDRWA